MKNLTDKEINFLDALKKDYAINGDKSYIEVLFQAGFKANSEMKKDLNELYEGSYQELFNNSDLLFESIQCCYVGKYKDTFWGTDSEGGIFGFGKEIQNIAFSIIFTEVGQVTDVAEKPYVIEKFKNYFNLDYDLYIQSYKDFCKSFCLEYKENLELIEKQSEEFNEKLNMLK